MSNDSRIELAKQYMKIDGSDSDDIVDMLFSAAAEYLYSAGISEMNTDTPRLYELAQYGLMLFWYDHPEEVGSDTNLPISVRSVINQIKPIVF